MDVDEAKSRLADAIHCVMSQGFHGDKADECMMACDEAIDALISAVRNESKTGVWYKTDDQGDKLALVGDIKTSS